MCVCMPVCTCVIMSERAQMCAYEYVWQMHRSTSKVYQVGGQRAPLPQSSQALLNWLSFKLYQQCRPKLHRARKSKRFQMHVPSQAL